MKAEQRFCGNSLWTVLLQVKFRFEDNRLSFSGAAPRVAVSWLTISLREALHWLQTVLIWGKIICTLMTLVYPFHLGFFDHILLYSRFKALDLMVNHWFSFLKPSQIFETRWVCAHTLGSKANLVWGPTSCGVCGQCWKGNSIKLQVFV